MSRYFPHNMGAVDRALRAFAIAPAATVAAVAVGVPSVLGVVLLAVAAIGLVTSAIGICPSYVPFAIDTHGRARRALPH